MLRNLAVVAVMLLSLGSTLSDADAVITGDAATGMELASDCAACHGDDGKGDGEFPHIAGMDPVSLVQALKGYKSGDLESEYMADYASDLSEQDMADLAVYYASFPRD